VTERVDVLVVGGGPAGLATAIEARQAGFGSTLLERRRPPIDVACGEGLMPAGVKRLKRLGVEISKADGRAFFGIRYLDGGVSAEARFIRGRGLGIRRTVLHDALRRRAEELGVDLRWGTSVRGLAGSAVETDHGAIRADWLVAADGRQSLLRRWAGIETVNPRVERFGIRRHYSMAPWTDLVEIHWADDAEAYVTPVGEDLVGVAVLTRRTPVDFDRDIGRFPELLHRLQGAAVASRDRGAGPFGQRPSTVLAGRIALVGDASGCLDPISGEGVSLAFGEAAALVGAIRRGAPAEYSGEHRRLFRAPSAVTRLLLECERRPRLRRVVLRSLARVPGVFSRVVDRVAAAGG